MNRFVWRSVVLLGMAGLGMAGVSLARAQAPPLPTSPTTKASAVPERWRESFAAFDAADRLQPPAPGGVLFVGSSSIRLWDGLESQFGPQGAVVLKRGFGGSRLQDCAELVDRLVLPYRPRQVVLYAGDNDLAEGRTPQQVLQSLQAFVNSVQRALPGTRITYLSIKPSPLRAALLPQVREANALVAAYSAATPGLEYVDIHSSMLDANGRPREDLYRDDRLHMNAKGYALWAEALAGHLQPMDKAPAVAAAVVSPSIRP